MTRLNLFLRSSDKNKYFRAFKRREKNKSQDKLLEQIKVKQHYAKLPGLEQNQT